MEREVQELSNLDLLNFYDYKLWSYCLANLSVNQLAVLFSHTKLALATSQWYFYLTINQHQPQPAEQSRMPWTIRSNFLQVQKSFSIEKNMDGNVVRGGYNCLSF
jgi:hypothetical protein